MCCSSLAAVFMAYGNPPALYPGPAVCNNEKPAESGETVFFPLLSLNEHNNGTVSVLQITIKASLKIMLLFEH